MKSLITLLAVMSLSTGAHAANQDFQDFLTNACRGAQPGTDLFVRCNVDSVDGDLSGDSEDSLNPTQSLANGTNAVAETRARIQALREKLKEQSEGPQGVEETDVKDTFQMSGFSLILNGEDGSIDRDVTSAERGYETDSTRVQVGFDYRISDNWLWGAIVGIEQYDTVYDPDQPGTNFDPGPSEGDTERDGVSVSLFTSSIIGENGYVDAILSWSSSDYTFRRVAVFQESSRTLPTREIRTTADTSGEELAFSAGMGLDRHWEATSLQLYTRINYQNSSIDPYTESGGNGFAMNIRTDDTTEVVGTLGLKLSRSMNTSRGVLVPQLLLEYENRIDADRQVSTQSFVEDTTGTEFRVVGDAVDKSYGRAGLSLLGGFPNGFTCFVGVDRIYGKDFIDELRITGGLRLEF